MPSSSKAPSLQASYSSMLPSCAISCQRLILLRNISPWTSSSVRHALQTHFSCSLGSARLPVLDCWFSHDALSTRPCRDCRARPCRARCCVSICTIATCIGNDCCVFTSQHCSLVAWATSPNISRFGAWTTARSMAITPISCVLCYVCV